MMKTAPNQSLRERNKIRLRAELLDAVLDLFCKDAPALTLEAVARQAGCSKATVYVYFPNGLTEMLCALYANISDEVYEDAEARRTSHRLPHDRIMGMVDALLSMAARPRRGLFYAQINPTFSPALQSVLGRTSERFSLAISNDLEDQFGPQAPALAVLIVGALGQASVKIAGAPGQKDRLREAMSVLLDRLLETGA